TRSHRANPGAARPHRANTSASWTHWPNTGAAWTHWTNTSAAWSHRANTSATWSHGANSAGAWPHRESAHWPGGSRTHRPGPSARIIQGSRAQLRLAAGLQEMFHLTDLGHDQRMTVENVPGQRGARGFCRSGIRIENRRQVDGAEALQRLIRGHQVIVEPF